MHDHILTTCALTLALSTVSTAQNRPDAGPLTPVRTALDRDADCRLSPEEIQKAPQALLALDKDGNGKLDGQELGMPPPRRGRRGPGGFGGPPGFGRPGGPGGPGGFGRGPALPHPLDVDANGEISSFEIKYAPFSLARLDGNRDGRLSERELAAGFKGIGGGGPRMGPRPGGFDRRDRGTQRRRIEPEELDFKDGTATIPDRETFRKLSYQGEEVMIDVQLTNLEFVKFQIEDVATGKPVLYFMNTKTHRAHPMFMQLVGIPGGRRPGGGTGSMRGVLVYRPLLKSPSGQTGYYTFEFEPNDAYPFDKIKLAHDILVEKSPMLRGNLAYHPLQRAVSLYERQKALYEKAKLPVFLDEDEYGELAFLPLNQATSFGRLRILNEGERPGIRDIVLLETLPNELSRVAGIVSAVRQTPLSHVNLRATQDQVPNAYISGASQDARIRPLIGKYVRYSVGADGYEIREASFAEVEAHFASARPEKPQTPVSDLSVREIRPLDEIGFEDWKVYGVKAANLAALDKLDLGGVMVPKGHAIPFHYYDAFMKHNGLYEKAAEMRADKAFQQDTDMRSKALARFRKSIKKGDLPEWMAKALRQLQDSYPAETALRCRSSTNNEDLPGFSGAGLYDSFTHKPDEGALEKTVKQVWASLWNFRAYEEREFHRIDHGKTAMAVLVHANYEGELANGVAVTDDVVYGTEDSFYLNSQTGEDLITNPGSDSVPEEILLDSASPRRDRIVRTSNRVEKGKRVLQARILQRLRQALATIDMEFRAHYNLSPRALFAMEVEFKVTPDGKLAIKQARPWVY